VHCITSVMLCCAVLCCAGARRAQQTHRQSRELKWRSSLLQALLLPAAAAAEAVEVLLSTATAGVAGLTRVCLTRMCLLGTMRLQLLGGSR
jgi:hypothetical protein